MTNCAFTSANLKEDPETGLPPMILNLRNRVLKMLVAGKSGTGLNMPDRIRNGTDSA